MKLPWRGWIFYGLAAIVVMAYILNGGLYVGSSLDFTRDADGKPSHNKVCHYLNFGGARYELPLGDRLFCPPFHAL
jgi:hypothetical protein